MVIAGKIFKLPEDTRLNTIAARLKDFSTEEVVDIGEQEITLATEVKDLEITHDSVEGIFSHDVLIEVFHRGKTISVPKTTDSTFLFSEYGKMMLLIVLENKQTANNIANRLGKILFITTGRIVEARIKPEVLQEFHMSNVEDTKVVFFDDVDIPNINKLSLYGSELKDTALYDDYCDHGKVWYVVIKSKKYGYIVGITRNCVVTIFSKIDKKGFVDYVRDEVYALVE
jgi:hypothetical protein